MRTATTKAARASRAVVGGVVAVVAGEVAAGRQRSMVLVVKPGRWVK